MIDQQLQSITQAYALYKQDLILHNRYNKTAMEIQLEKSNSFHVPRHCSVLTFKTCYRKAMRSPKHQNWKFIFRKYKFILNSSFVIPMQRNSFILPLEGKSKNLLSLHPN